MFVILLFLCCFFVVSFSLLLVYTNCSFSIGYSFLLVSDFLNAIIAPFTLESRKIFNFFVGLTMVSFSEGDLIELRS